MIALLKAVAKGVDPEWTIVPESLIGVEGFHLTSPT